MKDMSDVEEFSLQSKLLTPVNVKKSVESS